MPSGHAPARAIILNAVEDEIMLTGARIAVRSSFVFVAVAGFCSAYAQSGGDEVIRVVVQDARSPTISVSEEAESLIDAVEDEMRKRGQIGAVNVSESVRHDPAGGGSFTAPDGMVLCGKSLRPVSQEDHQNRRRDVARVSFSVGDGGRLVSWTSSAREGANSAALKHREFELTFVPVEFYRTLLDEGRCFG